MVVATLSFSHVQISRFSRNEPVTLRIFFNDGQARFFDKTTDISSTEALTQEVINEARRIAKENNAKKTGNFIDDNVMVRFAEDEEKLEEKMIMAFSRIKGDLKRVRTLNTATNYLQNIASFQGSKYNI